MTDHTGPDATRVFRALTPHATRRAAQVRAAGTRFAHYTSADAAMKILRGGHVWLRNARVMNDFLEVEHGQRCLHASWRDEAVGGRLRRLVERAVPGAVGELVEAFDARHADRIAETYMLSISEHGDGGTDEDRYGRLSMWRAYGGDANVAFVFRNRPFVAQSEALDAFTSPVLYRDEGGFKADFLEVVETLEREEEALAALPAGVLRELLLQAFHFAVLSTKHPGFAEEREWRVIYSPTLRPSDRLAMSVETIGGVPQRIYKVEFKDYPEEGLTGATVPDLLDRIIVGPTEYPWPIWDAFARVLGDLGVPEPHAKVVVSDIPLRRR